MRKTISMQTHTRQEQKKSEQRLTSSKTYTALCEVGWCPCPCPPVSTLKFSLFGIQIGMREFNSMCWLKVVDPFFFFLNIFGIFFCRFAHKHRERQRVFQKHLTVYHRNDIRVHQTVSAATTTQKNRMANTLNRDVDYYIFVGILFTVSTTCDNFMCHFCRKNIQHTYIHRGNGGYVRPSLFDARVYLRLLFFCCSFIHLIFDKSCASEHQAYSR